MKLHYKYPMLGSSIDPDKLALTIKGIIVGLIPIIILVAGLFGLSLDMTELNTLADAIQTAILAVSGAISACMVVWGLLRKLQQKIKK
jgi:hypothetical protein